MDVDISMASTDEFKRLLTEAKDSFVILTSILGASGNPEACMQFAYKWVDLTEACVDWLTADVEQKNSAWELVQADLSVMIAKPMVAIFDAAWQRLRDLGVKQLDNESTEKEKLARSLLESDPVRAKHLFSELVNKVFALISSKTNIQLPRIKPVVKELQ